MADVRIKASAHNRKAVAGRARAGERYQDADKGTLLYQKVTADSVRASVGYAAVSADNSPSYTAVTSMND